MPVYLQDPSVLTKERLKSELRAHNVELPGGNPTKDVYVQLYVKTVQSGGAEAVDVFSSDEELPPPVLSQRRSRSSGKKSGAGLERIDLTLLSDEDLRDQLLKHGVHAGPIVASTRKLYEKKLVKLLDNGANFSDPQIHRNSQEAEIHRNSGEAEVYSDQEDEVLAGPEPPVESSLELVPERSDSPCPPPAQRHSSSQHSITKVEMVEKVEKVTAEPAPSEEDSAVPELNSFTLMATSRQPIKGAASHLTMHEVTQLLESQSSVCASVPAKNTSSTPSTAIATVSSARSSSSTPSEPTAPGLSWWKKLLLLFLLLGFVFLLFQAMEPNTAETAEEL